MNPEKIGEFIKELREEKGLTQEKLGELIPIGREAISKWERGKNFPDYQSLIKLSEIFNISINELFLGEKLTEENRIDIDNVIGDIYQDRNKIKKKLFIVLIGLFFILTLFLGYYFYSNYNSVKVYDVKYNDDEISLLDGLLVVTREKFYFTTNEIESKNEIKKLKLYYKENNSEHLIMVTDDDKLAFINFNGSNEYFNYDNIKDIINNLYLEVSFKEENKDIKLNIVESFSNNYIIPRKVKSSSSNNIQIELPTMLELKLKEKLELDKSGLYFYRNKNEEIFYIEDAKTLDYFYNDNGITKEWYYYIPNDYLLYKEYEDNNILRSYEYYNITKEKDNQIIKILLDKIEEILK